MNAKQITQFQQRIQQNEKDQNLNKLAKKKKKNISFKILGVIYGLVFAAFGNASKSLRNLYDVRVFG